MADKPEAMRLADALETRAITFRDKAEAAAELRRLVAENERLHQINQSHEMKLSVRGYEIQIEDLMLAHAELRERNAELLEALDEIAINTHDDTAERVARAAIAKAEEA
jgi:hypothetical protein